MFIMCVCIFISMFLQCAPLWRHHAVVQQWLKTDNKTPSTFHLFTNRQCESKRKHNKKNKQEESVFTGGG